MSPRMHCFAELGKCLDYECCVGYSVSHARRVRMRNAIPELQRISCDCLHASIVFHRALIPLRTVSTALQWNFTKVGIALYCTDSMMYMCNHASQNTFESIYFPDKCGAAHQLEKTAPM